jgi:protein CpxP
MSFLLSLALTAPASAAEPTVAAEPGVADPAGRLEKWLDRVDATPAQRERIEAIAADVRERRESFREEGKELRQELRELLLAESIDRKAIEAVRQDFLQLVDRSSAYVLDHVVKAAEVLTPEQRATLAAHAPAPAQ